MFRIRFNRQMICRTNASSIDLASGMFRTWRQCPVVELCHTKAITDYLLKELNIREKRAQGGGGVHFERIIITNV